MVGEKDSDTDNYKVLGCVLRWLFPCIMPPLRPAFVADSSLASTSSPST